MSPPRAKSDVKRYGRQALLDPLKSQAAQSRGIKRKRSVTSQSEIQGQLLQLPSPISTTLDKEPKRPHNPLVSIRPSHPGRKRKRSEELGQNQNAGARAPDRPRSQNQERLIRKRRRVSAANPIVEGAVRTDLDRYNKNSDVNPIQRWIEEGSWSEENFEKDDNMS